MGAIARLCALVKGQIRDSRSSVLFNNRKRAGEISTDEDFIAQGRDAVESFHRRDR